MAVDGTASRVEDLHKGSVVVCSHLRKSSGLEKTQVCHSELLIILNHSQSDVIGVFAERTVNADQ